MSEPTYADLVARIDRAIDLHPWLMERVPDPRAPEFDVPFYYCRTCSPDGPDPAHPYPCPTVRALEGT